jgi:hypothetical protein
MIDQLTIHIMDWKLKQIVAYCVLAYAFVDVQKRSNLQLILRLS